MKFDFDAYHPPVEDNIDWDELRNQARMISERAYVPYSNFPVGAAALVDDGRIVVGCNVENASYGVGLCAECGLVSQLRATGGGRLVAFACVDATGSAIMPCGRCRQLLFEFGGTRLLLDTPEGIKPMSEVLPQAFGPDDLARVAEMRGGPTFTEVDARSPRRDQLSQPRVRHALGYDAGPADEDDPSTSSDGSGSVGTDGEEPETDA